MATALTCPVCLDFVAAARVTQCGHAFCAECLDTHVKHFIVRFCSLQVILDASDESGLIDALDTVKRSWGSPLCPSCRAPLDEPTYRAKALDAAVDEICTSPEVAASLKRRRNDEFADRTTAHDNLVKIFKMLPADQPRDPAVDREDDAPPGLVSEDDDGDASEDGDPVADRDENLEAAANTTDDDDDDETAPHFNVEAVCQALRSEVPLMRLFALRLIDNMPVDFVWAERMQMLCDDMLPCMTTGGDVEAAMAWEIMHRAVMLESSWFMPMDQMPRLVYTALERAETHPLALTNALIFAADAAREIPPLFVSLFHAERKADLQRFARAAPDIVGAVATRVAGAGAALEEAGVLTELTCALAYQSPDVLYKFVRAIFEGEVTQKVAERIADAMPVLIISGDAGVAGLARALCIFCPRAGAAFYDRHGEAFFAFVCACAQGASPRMQKDISKLLLHMVVACDHAPDRLIAFAVGWARAPTTPRAVRSTLIVYLANAAGSSPARARAVVDAFGGVAELFHFCSETRSFPMAASVLRHELTVKHLDDDARLGVVAAVSALRLDGEFSRLATMCAMCSHASGASIIAQSAHAVARLRFARGPNNSEQAQEAAKVALRNMEHFLGATTSDND